MITTTLDLIKALPLDGAFRKELLDSYESLDEERKFKIGRILWAAYDVLFEAKLSRNLAIAFDEAANNQEKLDKNFYNRVRDLTEQEMDKVSAEDIEATSLDITRDKLQELIKPQE
jgi:hypothetical protein